MLVLTRKLGEEIVIDGDIRITVIELVNGRVKLGVTAPKTVRVDRAEIRELREKADAPLPSAEARNRLAEVVNPVIVANAVAAGASAPPSETPASPLANRLPPARVPTNYRRKAR